MGLESAQHPPAFLPSGAPDLDGLMTLLSNAVPERPPVEMPYRRQLPIRQGLVELWRSKALVATLAERDLRVRYKQAILGFAWALLNPIVLLVAFTIIFERVAHVNTNGAPYPLFSYLGLLPWTFFSECIGLGANSIISDQSILNKVHFPREAFPLGDLLVAMVDFCMALVALVALFGIERFVPRATMYWLPVFVPITLAFTIGVMLTVAGIVVYFRDLVQLVPIFLQIGLFGTPVAYPFSFIPTGLQPLYAIVNPLGPVIDGVRRTVLYGQAPSPLPLAVAAASSMLIMTAGYLIFKRLEMGFADVA